LWDPSDGTLFRLGPWVVVSGGPVTLSVMGWDSAEVPVDTILQASTAQVRQAAGSAAREMIVERKMIGEGVWWFSY